MILLGLAVLFDYFSHKPHNDIITIISLRSNLQESLIILLLAPVILAISSLLFASFSIPTLILRGLADWGTGYLQRIKTTRDDEIVLQAVNQDIYLQEDPVENLDQNPRFIF